jgi:hypothetical protein
MIQKEKITFEQISQEPEQINFKNYKEAFDYGKANFYGDYQNIYTDEILRISKETLVKTMKSDTSRKKSVSEEIHIKAFAKLPYIVIHGRPIDSPRPCKKGVPEIKNVQNFEIEVSIDEKEYTANAFVKRYHSKLQGNLVYYYLVKKMELVEKRSALTATHP